MKFHEDDRAQRLLDIFPLNKGQINVHYFHSTESICAWHRHKIQTDYFCCIQGSFKVGLCLNNKVEFYYLSDKNIRESFFVPPGMWHGYRPLKPNSIMLYYLTEKYDPTDEEKVLPGFFGENWSTISK